MKFVKKLNLIKIPFAILLTLSMTTSLFITKDSSGQLNVDEQEIIRQQMENSLNYVHKADIGNSVETILLNGLNLTKDDFILLFDSTPFASRGHIALTLPCSVENPQTPDFKILVGRAPDLFDMGLGYISNSSSPPRQCLYHGQFGFGDPVTDIILKYTGDESLLIQGPYSVSVSTHESFLPTTESFFELRHHNTNQTK